MLRSCDLTAASSRSLVPTSPRPGASGQPRALAVAARRVTSLATRAAQRARGPSRCAGPGASSAKAGVRPGRRHLTPPPSILPTLRAAICLRWGRARPGARAGRAPRPLPAAAEPKEEPLGPSFPGLRSGASSGSGTPACCGPQCARVRPPSWRAAGPSSPSAPSRLLRLDPECPSPLVSDLRPPHPRSREEPGGTLPLVPSSWPLFRTASGIPPAPPGHAASPHLGTGLSSKETRGGPAPLSLEGGSPSPATLFTDEAAEASRECGHPLAVPPSAPAHWLLQGEDGYAPPALGQWDREPPRPDSAGQALWAGGGPQEISQRDPIPGLPPPPGCLLLSPSLPLPLFFFLFYLIWLPPAGP